MVRAAAAGLERLTGFTSSWVRRSTPSRSSRATGSTRRCWPTWKPASGSSNAGEVCDHVAARHVVLIGLPRAGRTSIARLLAKVLERPFAEVDEVLELATGCPLPRLRRQRGEAEVRRLEGRLLAEMLGRCAPLVISAPEATEVGREIRSVVADSAVVFWIRDRVRLPGEVSALCQELADRVVDVEVFQSLDGDPEPLIVGHILEQLAASDLPGPVRLPTPPAQAIVDGHEARSPVARRRVVRALPRGCRCGRGRRAVPLTRRPHRGHRPPHRRPGRPRRDRGRRGGVGRSTSPR